MLSGVWCDVDVMEFSYCGALASTPKEQLYIELADGLRGSDSCIGFGSQVAIQETSGTLGAIVKSRIGNQEVGFLMNRHVTIDLDYPNKKCFIRYCQALDLVNKPSIFLIDVTCRGAIGQPRILVPVILVMVYNGLNSYMDPTRNEVPNEQTPKVGGENVKSVGLGKALARMIIVYELPFKFVKGEGFRFYMSIVQPRFPLLGRITVAKDCWNLYISEKNRMKTVFKQSNQSVCLTTAHYIDHDWKLQKRIINFCLIKNHKGETIGRKIERCLLGWGISRVFTITVDNASSNDTVISYLRTRMEDWNLHPLKGEHLHVRCCAHILNLVVNESISKTRNAIRYVRTSPSHMNRFKNFIKEARIQDKCTVQLDVPTRWNSTYTMLESGLKFLKAFKRLGERDTEYALMQGGIPRNIDWDNAKHFMEFMKIFHDVTKSVSGSFLVTSSQYFHEFCKILRVFKASCGSRDPLLGNMAERMRLKYDKYWGNIKNINMIILVSVVLDPRYKLKFVNFSFEKLYDKDDVDFFGAKVKETFSKIFECYVNANNGGRSFTSATMDGASDVGVPNGDMAGDFFKEVHFHEIINKNEVDLYLMDGLEKPRDQNTFDILNWWKTIEALICTQNWLHASSMTTDFEELIKEFERLELEIAPTGEDEDESGVDSD
ncbi:zinc finger BED domain-containing protein RICESLEEPER 2-like [Arachis stenosperma]|uniref:zinc finger BED domain-containing protein RICESLEEPER 2-like n=1 Tax=Arachis stenosperma TaxID=217475 RepID=UPI0025AC4DEC|nr:zinc finger BED domain-containing protein RICESLEEPER 2-like [Arachis stenosperma]